MWFKSQLVLHKNKKIRRRKEERRKIVLQVGVAVVKVSNIMDSRGRGKKERKWSTKEVDVTLDFVLELKGDSRWRYEGGFKNGFHQHLAEKLENFFPVVGLTVAQIESKLKILKEKYTVIHEMTKLFGFTWDEETSMINCERQSYNDYCKIHPRAAGLWKKPFPEFAKSELIFGAHRATGIDAEDVKDMVNNIDNEYIDLESPLEESDHPASDEESHPPHSKKQKRTGKSPLENNLFDAELCKAIKAMNGHLNTLAETVTRQDNREEYVSTQKKMLMSEISMLPGVSDLDAIEASRIILRTPSELDNFYNCPNDHWKKLYVQSIIVRLRASSGDSRAAGL